MIDQERYDVFMETVTNHSGGMFLQFRLDHVRQLNGNCTAAAVLAFILNLLRMKHENAADRKSLRQNDLFMKCPAGDIQTKFGMREDRQRSAITNLTTAKLIETRRSVGNILWVKVNDKELKKLQKRDQKQMEQEEEGGYPETGKSRNRKRENPGTGNGKIPEPIDKESYEESYEENSHPTPKRVKKLKSEKLTVSVSQECLAVARLMFNKVKEVSGVTLYGQVSGWAKHLAILCERTVKGGEGRVLAVFRWYVNNLGKVSGLPEIFAAKGISDQTFLWIEGVMNKTDPPEDQPRVKVTYEGKTRFVTFED